MTRLEELAQAYREALAAEALAQAAVNVAYRDLAPVFNRQRIAAAHVERARDALLAEVAIIKAEFTETTP